MVVITPLLTFHLRAFGQSFPWLRDGILRRIHCRIGGKRGHIKEFLLVIVRMAFLSRRTMEKTVIAWRLWQSFLYGVGGKYYDENIIAVPVGGQTTWNSTGVSPKGGCGPQWVNVTIQHIPATRRFYAQRKARHVSIRVLSRCHSLSVALHEVCGLESQLNGPITTLEREFHLCVSPSAVIVAIPCAACVVPYLHRATDTLLLLLQ